MDREQGQLAKAGKAAGLIDHGLPDNCVRIVVSSPPDPIGSPRFAVLDQPAWRSGDSRCARSRAGVIVFQRSGKQWRVVRTASDFEKFGGCPVRPVPTPLAKRLRLC